MFFFLTELWAGHCPELKKMKKKKPKTPKQNKPLSGLKRQQKRLLLVQQLRNDRSLYLGGLPAEQQVGGCDLVVLHLGQRLLDLFQVVAHPHHHICSRQHRKWTAASFLPRSSSLNSVNYTSPSSRREDPICFNTLKTVHMFVAEYEQGMTCW